jgi:uncharacterized Zn finger protein (UPF0148 family)
MGFFNRRKKKTKLCPNCGKPFENGTVFCDSCGLRLSPPPACPKCGLPLAPGTNFCEACGTPVGSVPAPCKDRSATDEKSPDIPKTGRSSKRKKPHQKTPPPAPSVRLPDSVTTITDKPDMEKVTQVHEVPGEIPLPGEFRGTSLVVRRIAPENADPLRERSLSRRKTIISCILVVGLILVITLMTGMLKVPTKISPGALNHGEAIQSHDDTRPVSIETTVPLTLPSLTPALTPGPTRVPPESLLIWVQAERDPITNNVTVLFEGGKGQSGVRMIEARLTRSDGDVRVQTFKPTTVGEGAVITGTKFSDRLEVIVFYNNGDQYTVIDKIFAYKGRS